MNKPQIKNFSVWARRKLIETVSYRMSLIGITEKGIADALPQSTADLKFYDIGTGKPAEVKGKDIAYRSELVSKIGQDGYKNTVEEIAYTWFNRLIAIRFMEVNNYLPSRVRVLSSLESGKSEPDIVTEAISVAEENGFKISADEIYRLKDENKADELFGKMFEFECRQLNSCLPELFGKSANYMEMLLPVSYTDKDGIIYHLVHDIPEDDFKDGIQIMKDYMASGSFARGKEEKSASASMVFVGNINQDVEVLLKTSSLFDPFPPEMGTDTAFLDRIHCYLPGWEIPKFRPEHFTGDYGFITDYFAEFVRELRKEQFGDALDKYFKLGRNLNQRDTIAVRKMVGGYIKLLYPDGNYTKEDIEEILKISLEMRRRVKEQLKKLGGMEFYDINFSYIDNETFEEHYVSVPEQSGGKLIPEGMCNPGQVYTVSRGKSGMIGVFRLESQALPGTGKFERTGLGSERDAKEASNTAFNYLKANGNKISGAISTVNTDYIINYQDLQGIGMTSTLALPTLIALASIALGKPTVGSIAVLGEISISGTLIKMDNLADTLQVCLDSGAKKVLLPMMCAADFGTVPPELLGSFQIIFYNSAEDAVFKALGVE